MTGQRMDDLLDELRNYGWYLRGEHEHPNASLDPFALDDDGVTWVIARADSPSVVELEFRAFGRLGLRSNALRDIGHCRVVGGDETLYFAKRNKPEWRRDLVAFAQRVGRGRPDERGTPSSGTRR
jgi:hypothetical protein